MAISAPTQSAQYVNYVSKPPVLNLAYDWGAKLRQSFAKLTFTAAGYTTAATGDIFLIHMPPGKVRIMVDLCRVVCPQGTSTSDLDIGVSKYTNAAGAAVTAVNNALADSLDVGGGAIDQTLPLPAIGFYEVESQNGFDIVCSFDTANSPASGDMYMAIVYSQGN